MSLRDKIGAIDARIAESEEFEASKPARIDAMEAAGRALFTQIAAVLQERGGAETKRGDATVETTFGKVTLPTVQVVVRGLPVVSVGFRDHLYVEAKALPELGRHGQLPVAQFVRRIAQDGTETWAFRRKVMKQPPGGRPHEAVEEVLVSDDVIEEVFTTLL